MRRAADAEEAMAWAYDAVIENHPDTNYMLWACEHMGRYYYEQKRWAEAIGYLEEWYEKQPEHWYVRNMLDTCLEQLEAISE